MPPQRRIGAMGWPVWISVAVFVIVTVPFATW